MAGVQNKAARQIDLRGRRPGAIGDAAICCVTLNPGFNVVDDKDLDLCMKNPHNRILEDEGVIVVGARRTREDELVAREVEAREKDAFELQKPRAAASLVPGPDSVRAKPADPLEL